MPGGGHKRSHFITLFTKAAYWCGVIATAIPVLALVGYFLRVRILTSGLHNAVPMNPLTALSFLLAVLSLFLLLARPFSPTTNTRLGKVSALALVLVGASRLIAYVIGTPFRFDTLLFPDRLTDEVTGYVVNMAPNTAICFFAFGMALYLLHRRAYELVAQLFAAFAMFVAILPLVGYLYGVRDLLGISSFIPMSPNTAVTMIIFALGVLLARADNGFMTVASGEDAAGTLARWMLLLTLVSPAFWGYLALSGVASGVYGAGFAVAIQVLSNTVLGSALMIGIALYLQRIDMHRLQAEATLHDQQIRSQAILASIGDGLVAIDEKWMIMTWNAAAESITGVKAEAAIGKPFREVVRFIREKDRTENVLFISDAMLSKKVRFMDAHTLLLRKDGTEIPVGDSASPILDAGGKVLGAVIVFRDLTQEKRDSLSRSGFAYASHQLHNPVVQALWNLELAMKEKSPKLLREDVAIAYRSVQSVRRLIEEIVEVSKLEEGQVVPVLDDARVGDLTQAITAMVNKHHLDQLELSSHGLIEQKHVRIDLALFEKLMFEIIDNAYRYSAAQGSVTFTVTSDGDRVVFTVNNKGSVIPTEEQPLVFTKFFRGSNVPRDVVGAGLGLYLARLFAQLLHATIWFTSDMEDGTVFHVALPLVTEAKAVTRNGNGVRKQARRTRLAVNRSKNKR